jgi:two-component system phosphate regulon sensor histidine kinase PhoR
LKLELSTKVFLVLFGLIVASTITGFLYSRRALDQNYAEIVREDLESRANLVAAVVEQETAPFSDTVAWNALAKNLGVKAQARVTLIELDGRVVADSEVALGEVPKMDNHAQRPEVAEAVRNGIGHAERSSATLNRSMVYMATRFSRQGQPAGIVRVALTSRSVEAVAATLRDGAAIGSLMTLLVALIVSVVVVQFGAKRTRALTVVATSMANGDLTARTGIRGGNEFGKLGVALDQLAESLSSTLQQLRAERDRLDAVLSGMAEGVLLLDRDGRVALVNPALRSMGLVGEGVEGKTLSEVIQNADLSALLEGASDTRETVSGELELAVPSAARVLVRTRPLAGVPGGLVAVFVDVTDLRRLEGLRRDFVANASHELRTPIASIHSAAETLVAGASEDPDSRARFLKIVMRNAVRLHQLVEDMLDLSRIESRGFTLLVEPVKPAVVVDLVVSAVLAEASAKQIELVCDISRDVTVLADAHALEQILMNLVDNAIKYCPQGSHVSFACTHTDGSVALMVRDDGRGIDHEHLPRLFERFYRVDSGRSREVGGTGLGLAIVKHLAEAMNGSISVESHLGKGTTFTVKLPAA